MIKTMTYYDCDLCTNAAGTEGHRQPEGWVALPEGKTVCPYCAEAISTRRERAAKLESNRYQHLLEAADSKRACASDIFGTNQPRSPGERL